MKPGWRSEKSAAAWELTLGKYCVSIRRNPVADLTVEHISAQADLAIEA
jgi:hypothetical protein